MSKLTMKEEMERESGKPLTFAEDGLVALLSDVISNEILPAQEIKMKKEDDIEYLQTSIDLIEVRIEALKLAYDLAYKVGNFSRSYEPGSFQFKRDIEDTFELADMNVDYIMDNRND